MIHENAEDWSFLPISIYQARTWIFTGHPLDTNAGLHSRGFPTIHLSKIRPNILLLVTGILWLWQPQSTGSLIVTRLFVLSTDCNKFFYFFYEPARNRASHNLLPAKILYLSRGIGWSSFWMTFPMSEAELCRGIFFCQASAQRKSLHPLFLF